jgi:hypothetical protein
MDDTGFQTFKRNAIKVIKPKIYLSNIPSSSSIINKFTKKTYRNADTRPIRYDNKHTAKKTSNKLNIIPRMKNYVTGKSRPNIDTYNNIAI